MRKYRKAPHPFVIEVPPSDNTIDLLNRTRSPELIFRPGDRITFGLVLIGRAIDYLPYFVYTFSELGKMGIGRGRGRFSLEMVLTEKGEEVYSAGSGELKSVIPDELVIFPPVVSNTDSIRITFQTPARIKYNGRLTKDISFHVIIRQLIRRVSLLGYFHAGLDPEGWDIMGVIRKAESVCTSSSRLEWYDWERYSSRQQSKMMLGGFIGEITFEGDIGPFMGLLRAGEVIHIGKGTTFGLGRYRIYTS
jgi:hypothetical protein